MPLSPADFSYYILDIDDIFFAEGAFGYTTRLCDNEWDERYTPQILNFISALNSLTKHGVFLVHGDIKPSNIVIDEDFPLLIDFDISSVALTFDNESMVQFTSEVILSRVKTSSPKDPQV
jgi:serine/threonine protein kinase